jgi:hypothetical protein
VSPRRSVASALAASVLVVAAGAFAPASAAGKTERELVSDAVAQAFTLRAQVDYGGAAKLPFFFGSYADANLSNPPAGADGQASWYNLGIAETAVFTPPGECTSTEQQRRVMQAVTDVGDWITKVAVPTLLAGNVPVLPLPTLPCTERLPGFVQSRYPATETIPSSGTDDLLGSALCHYGACPVRDALAPLSSGMIDGGRFVASATPKPSQASDATMVGLHIPGVLDIGVARSIATAALDGDTLVTEAVWTAKDVCVAPGVSGCALSIRSIGQFARLERDADGRVTTRDARTVIAGVSGGGRDVEITADDLGPGLAPIDLGGRLQIRGVSATAGCGDPASGSVADAGGLEITGNGAGGPGVSLPVPLVGSATGGGIMLGGACASGRLQAVTISLPGPVAPGPLSNPGNTIVIPPAGGGGSGGAVVGPQMSGPRVVSKESVRYVLRRAPAWRTAKYWVSVLAALVLLGALGFVFRRSRPVAPVTAALDRFARQFVRG